MKVYLWPFFGGEDNGEGGVRRVLEKQTRYLPNHGVEIVTDPGEADVIAFHILQDTDVVRRFPNKPIVAHCHGLYWSEYEWQNWAKKTNKDVLDLIRIADIITTPSEWVSQIIRRHTARRVMTVHHGVEMDEFSPGKNQGYVLWNKNRTDPVCDPWPMQAVAQLLPEIKFVSTHGEKTKNVVITDTVPYEEAKEYVRNAGVYLATTRETFGIGTLEAMAAGAPVVGYNWGGQREIITHKVDGWLCQPDDIDGLAEGIKWAIENREEIGAAARSTAERFTWERSCELYKEAYDRAYAYRNSKSEQRTQPLVSVIVPAYNRGETLERTIKSIKAQSMGNFECIIVDDGSTDATGEIADNWSYQDSRIKVIHHEENKHVSAARNTGLENATGKYIIQVDSDDELTPTALEILSSELEKDRNIHIVYGNLLFVDENNFPINYGSDPGHSGWPMEYDFNWHVHLARNVLPYCSMYRREVWELTGGYRTRYRTGEDADFWMRAASYGFKPKMITKEDILVYHVSNSSLSATEPKVPWEDWYPWKRYENLVLAGSANDALHPEVTSFEPTIVSVVIPVGPGHGKYLLDAIDSVQAQTFPNWECIVVNDTDEPLPNLPSWVRVIETDGGIGPAAARNLGIHISKGKLFLPLDADDYLQPNALDTMMKIWLENTDKIVYCDHFDDQVEEGVFEVHHNPDYDPNILIQHGCLHSVTALTLKEYWEKVGGYDENLLAWEDWGFQLACASVGICEIHAPYPLFTYRKHTGKRRNDNYDKFELSKASILDRFGKYFGENREELMACGSCGSGNKAAFSLPATVTMKLQQPPVDDAVLIRCNREGEGELTYRGPSGNQYLFANGQEKYVLQEDVQHFIDRGFTVAIHNEIRQEPVLTTSVAPEPHRELAAVGAETILEKPMFAFDDLPAAIPSEQPDLQFTQDQIESEEPTPRRRGRPAKNAG